MLQLVTLAQEETRAHTEVHFLSHSLSHESIKERSREMAVLPQSSGRALGMQPALPAPGSATSSLQSPEK